MSFVVLARQAIRVTPFYKAGFQSGNYQFGNVKRVDFYFPDGDFSFERREAVEYLVK